MHSKVLGGYSGGYAISEPLENVIPQDVVAKFIVEGEPVSKSRARFTKRGSRTFAYTPHKTHDGEKAIARAFRAAMPADYEPDGEYHFGVSASFFNASRQRRDVDNMLKLVLDGLNGIAWADDNQVTAVAARKSYESEKSSARTEVVIYRAEKIKPPSANCQFCGVEFLMYRSTSKRKYCSRACDHANRRRNRTTTCKQCGISFDPGREKWGALFCTTACQNRHNRADVTCFICGNGFQVPKSQVHLRPMCSDECRAIRDSMCKNGHPREGNTAVRPNGTRYCMVCNRDRVAKRRKVA